MRRPGASRAEGRRSKASAAIPVGLDAELRRGLGFTETDLATNRGGHIGRGQRRRLDRSAVVWALVAVSCVALAIAIVITLGTDSGKGIQRYWPAILVLAAAAWPALNAFREFDEVAHGELKSWHGTLTCERKPKRLSTNYGPSVTYDFDYAVNGGGHRWQIPYRLYQVFENGLDYRVFYGGEGGAMLSIEALGTPDPNAQHHHRSTTVLDTPATALLSGVALFLTVSFLLLGIAWAYTPLIVVSLATLGVIVLFLAHVVPFVLASRSCAVLSSSPYWSLPSSSRPGSRVQTASTAWQRRTRCRHTYRRTGIGSSAHPTEVSVAAGTSPSPSRSVTIGRSAGQVLEV